MAITKEVQELQTRLQSIQTMHSTTQTEKKKYNCPKCNDTEWVINPKTNSCLPCDCRESNYYQRLLEHSGISEGFRRVMLNDYKPYDDLTKQARDCAVKYIKDFDKIERKRENSLALLGTPGAGKTTLAIGVANNLLKQKIGVLYMPYMEAVIRLKQYIYDNPEEYENTIHRYKNARVLLIDDLFKEYDPKRSATDVKIMFDIINHRYLNFSPIIISSEKTMDNLKSIDIALGSRIVDMCYNRIIQFKDMKYNYRLRER